MHAIYACFKIIYNNTNHKILSGRPVRLRARRTTTARPQVVLKKGGGPALALELGRVPVVVRGHDLLFDHDGLSVLPQDVDRVNQYSCTIQLYIK